MEEFERERWRGQVDEQLRTITKTLIETRSDIHSLETLSKELELRVERLATRIAIYSSLGAFAGGGVVSVIVGLFFKR